MSVGVCKKLDVVRVANIPKATTSEQLRVLFAQHGDVQLISLVHDEGIEPADCCGWVYMPQAGGAVKALDQAEFHGRRLEVKFMGVLLPQLKPIAA